MPRLSRKLAGAVAIFAIVMLVGAWPSQSVRAGFSGAVSAIANVVLRPARFAGGALLELRPLRPDVPRKAGQNVDEDTQLVLRVPGQRGEATLGISLRRDAYLPFVIFVAAILALPIGRRAKAASLALGTPVVVAVAIASVWLLVAHLTSQRPGAPVEWHGSVTTFLFERWLTPPGNRVIAPLLFAAALGYAMHEWLGPKKAPSNTSDDTGSAIPSEDATPVNPPGASLPDTAR